MVMSSLHPPLNSVQSDVLYNEKLSEWQKTRREYERNDFEEAPQQLQEHLILRFEEMDADCTQVILAIENYSRSNKSWHAVEGCASWTVVRSARTTSAKGRAKARPTREPRWRNIQP